MKIAWIGTGLMGKLMLKRLADFGHYVNAYNRTYSKLEDLLNYKNISCFKSISQAIKDTDLIMTMVGSPDDVWQIYYQTETGILNLASTNQICIDFTTSDPLLANKIANNKQNIKVLDAPVSGGEIGAKNGTLSIMVGGEEAVFNKVKPILNILGNKVIYFGNSGNGQHAKLFNQILVAFNTYMVAEAISYCKLHKIDLRMLINLLRKTIANSWQLVNNGTKMVDNDLDPGFSIKHFLKDLQLIKTNQKTYLYGVNEIFKQYLNLVNQDANLNEFGTQAIYDFLKKEGV